MYNFAHLNQQMYYCIQYNKTHKNPTTKLLNLLYIAVFNYPYGQARYVIYFQFSSFGFPRTQDERVGIEKIYEPEGV